MSDKTIIPRRDTWALRDIAMRPGIYREVPDRDEMAKALILFVADQIDLLNDYCAMLSKHPNDPWPASTVANDLKGIRAADNE